MYVYILQSQFNSKKHYIGATTNLRQKITEHNQGKSSYTAKYKPWKIIAAIWFKEKSKALAFEKYLKHGSGHAFAKRHFYN